MGMSGSCSKVRGRGNSPRLYETWIPVNRERTQESAQKFDCFQTNQRKKAFPDVCKNVTTFHLKEWLQRPVIRTRSPKTQSNDLVHHLDNLLVNYGQKASR